MKQTFQPRGNFMLSWRTTLKTFAFLQKNPGICQNPNTGKSIRKRKEKSETMFDFYKNLNNSKSVFVFGFL